MPSAHFLRTTVRAYTADRIELAPQFVEVERPRENFAFTHLPEEVEALFKEALTCYSSGAFNAFASMCRRTTQAMFADLGEVGKLRLYDELNNVRAMAELDAESFARVKRVVFGSDSDPRPNPPLLESHSAAVLLENMKDLLYEAYVRKGKLQQAMMVRRYFVEEKANNPAPATGPSASTPSAPIDPRRAGELAGSHVLLLRKLSPQPT